MLKHLPRRQHQPCRLRRRHQLDRQTESPPNAKTTPPPTPAPNPPTPNNPRQHHLRLTGRRHIITTHRSKIRSRQRLTIQLPLPSWNANPSTTTHTDGTMKAGRPCTAAAFTTSRSTTDPPEDTYPTNTCEPPGPSTTAAAACTTPGAPPTLPRFTLILDGALQLHLEITAPHIPNSPLTIPPHHITRPVQLRPRLP